MSRNQVQFFITLWDHYIMCLVEQSFKLSLNYFHPLTHALILVACTLQITIFLTRSCCTLLTATHRNIKFLPLLLLQQTC